MNASTLPAAWLIRPAAPSPYGTGITPCPASHAWFAGLASPITVAPALRASWTAIEPTPPAAPDTTTTSPLAGATARTAAYAVAPATNSPPATGHGTSGGLRVRLPASTTTNSAWLDRLSV